MLSGSYTGIDKYERAHTGMANGSLTFSVCVRQNGHMYSKATSESQY